MTIIPPAFADISLRDSEGEGPAVLLIHGNSSSGEIFRRQFEDPQLAHLRLVAFDLPGHGASTDDDYSTAVRLIHREKYADAIPYLNRALADRPHSANTLSYLGYTHRMLGDYPGSLDFYQKALAIDPDHKGAHEYLGELYLMMHDSGSANTQLAELTRLCPDGCDEKDALTKSIADYQSKAAATSPAATPATTQQ